MEPLIYDRERVKLFEGSLQALLSVRAASGEKQQGHSICKQQYLNTAL